MSHAGTGVSLLFESTHGHTHSYFDGLITRWDRWIGVFYGSRFSSDGACAIAEANTLRTLRLEIDLGVCQRCECTHIGVTRREASNGPTHFDRYEQLRHPCAGRFG